MEEPSDGKALLGEIEKNAGEPRPSRVSVPLRRPDEIAVPIEFP